MKQFQVGHLPTPQAESTGFPRPLEPSRLAAPELKVKRSSRPHLKHLGRALQELQDILQTNTLPSPNGRARTPGCCAKPLLLRSRFCRGRSAPGSKHVLGS